MCASSSRIQCALRLWADNEMAESSETLSGGSATDAERLISRVVRNWEPKYMPLACPLICALLIGPSASIVGAACRMAKHPEHPRPVFLEMLKLVVGKIGDFWEIGSSMLGKYHLGSLAFGFLSHYDSNVLVSAELIQLCETHNLSSGPFIPTPEYLQRLPLLLPKSLEVPIQRRGQLDQS